MDQTSFDELLKIQRMMASKIMDESSMDAKIKLYNMIRDMTTGKNKTIQIEQVLIEASSEGFTESETLSMLEELKTDGYVREAGESAIIVL